MVEERELIVKICEKLHALTKHVIKIGKHHAWNYLFRIEEIC